MPSSLRLGVIFEVGTRVQHRVIMQELNVTRPQGHAETEVLRYFLHRIERGLLCRGHSLYLRQALGRPDIRVHTATGEIAGVTVENTDGISSVLSLRHLAEAVAVKPAIERA